MSTKKSTQPKNHGGPDAIRAAMVFRLGACRHDDQWRGTPDAQLSPARMYGRETGVQGPSGAMRTPRRVRWDWDPCDREPIFGVAPGGSIHAQARRRAATVRRPGRNRRSADAQP